MRILFHAAWLLVALSACQNKGTSTVSKFTDTVATTVADLQDRRDTKGLLPYLDDKDAAIRRGAALAFASVQDSTAVQKLIQVLANDPDTTVRQAAAFALGQTRSQESAPLMAKAFARESNMPVLNELVEAYGKRTTKWNLKFFANDTLAAGLAWSYYRLSLRGLSDTLMNLRAGALLQNPVGQTPLAASHYFARGAKDFDSQQYIIITTAMISSSPDVRMAAALALRKVKTDTARLAAQHLALHDDDYRVRVNAVRALQSFPFSKTKDVLEQTLKDSVVAVGVATAEMLKNVVTADQWKWCATLARDAKNWRIQVNLYDAALSMSNNKELAEEIMKAYESASSAYHKAGLLGALQGWVPAHDFVHDKLMSEKSFVIKSSAANTLVAMNQNKTFDRSLTKKFATLYRAGIETGDPGVIAIYTQALSDPALGYKKEIADFSFLTAAKQKLSLPQHFEALQPLEAAIAYFEGKETPAPLKNEFNHPIDWKLVKSIPTDQKVLINTSKGKITIRLLVDEAPGSVANFVALARAKKFDHKFFHRVVPNFVVQAGCDRGDGYGGEPYSIRSEFSLRRYRTGSVGMASAGKDTESTQWFITHSPTPHLDGGYTIFAEVESGMEVVHALEMGDEIIDVTLVQPAP